MTAILTALLAALCFGATSVLQHRAASAPSAPEGTGALRLTVHLLGQPGWLLGMALGAAGFALQAAALHAGRLVVVQPLLATGLVFALVLGSLGAGGPSRSQWWAAAGTVAGLALFLVSAHPAAGTATGRGSALAVGTVAALALCGLARAAAGGRHGAALLGLAAGTGFGVVGALLKEVVGTPPNRLLLTWTPYALVVLAVCAGTLAQAAFQAGSLVECLPALTVLEPLAAVAVGARGFSESLATSGVARIGQVAGLVLMALAVVRLAALQAPDPSPKSRVCSSPVDVVT